MTPAPSDLTDDAAWDAVAGAHVQANFLQAAAWGRVRRAQGWRVERVATPSAAVQVLVRRTPLGELGYAPRGPLLDPADAAAGDDLRRHLRRALGRRAIAVRFEPPWPDAPDLRRRLGAWGWREVAPVQPASTLVVDLSPSADALLSAMKQKWRYNIRVAQRSGVTVREGGAPDLATFERLLAETAIRDGFNARPPGYYAGVWQAFGRAARLCVAERDGTVLAAILVLFVAGTATYLYGASGSQDRQLMPNHLLQWHAMTAAKAAGLRRYDLWGIPDAIGLAAAAGQSTDLVPAGQGGLWGVWGFKRGFGGRVVRYVGAWDEVYDPWRYRLARWIERRTAVQGDDREARTRDVA